MIYLGIQFYMGSKLDYSCGHQTLRSYRSQNCKEKTAFPWTSLFPILFKSIPEDFGTLFILICLSSLMDLGLKEKVPH